MVHFFKTPKYTGRLQTVKWILLFISIKGWVKGGRCQCSVGFNVCGFCHLCIIKTKIIKKERTRRHQSICYCLWLGEDTAALYWSMLFKWSAHTHTHTYMRMHLHTLMQKETETIQPILA